MAETVRAESSKFEGLYLVGTCSCGGDVLSSKMRLDVEIEMVEYGPKGRVPH